MSSEFITLFMFSTMLVLLVTGQRVFGIIGFVGAAAALWLWGAGSAELPFNAAFKLLNWFPLITIPFFVFMGFILSESGIASNLYRMFHIWFGSIRGGLALGTIGLMVLISCMNGLSVAGMAIGATVALPELLKRGYDKRMVTGVVQAGSSLGILVPPRVVLVLYAMIARQPVLQLWLAGVVPGLMMAGLFAAMVVVIASAVATRVRLLPEVIDISFIPTGAGLGSLGFAFYGALRRYEPDRIGRLTLLGTLLGAVGAVLGLVLALMLDVLF
jgi:TRAP-type mannitol/chloroaromatic compound transport system permease large subunit